MMLVRKRLLLNENERTSWCTRLLNTVNLSPHSWQTGCFASSYLRSVSYPRREPLRTSQGGSSITSRQTMRVGKFFFFVQKKSLKGRVAGAPQHDLFSSLRNPSVCAYGPTVDRWFGSSAPKHPCRDCVNRTNLCQMPPIASWCAGSMWKFYLLERN